MLGYGSQNVPLHPETWVDVHGRDSFVLAGLDGSCMGEIRDATAGEAFGWFIGRCGGRAEIDVNVLFDIEQLVARNVVQLQDAWAFNAADGLGLGPPWIPSVLWSRI